MTPGSLKRFGIRSLMIDPSDDLFNMPGEDTTALKTIISRSRVISFINWSEAEGMSDRWDQLLQQVIKPLGRKDFEFVFFLGDTSTRSVNAVDEILDIISAFSYCGRVTFILEGQELKQLYKTLTGQPSTSTLSVITRFIFNTMRIAHLLVYTENQVLFYSGQQQQEWPGSTLPDTGSAAMARDIFNAAYCEGLKQQLDITQCVALGLAAIGAWTGRESNAFDFPPASPVGNAGGI